MEKRLNLPDIAMASFMGGDVNWPLPEKPLPDKNSCKDIRSPITVFNAL
jgi:hypothetical protein